MKTFIKPSLIVLTCIFVISLITLPYLFYKSRTLSLSCQFNGRVDSVAYDAKGEPTIKIHDKKYHLPVNYWNFNGQIQVGDSLIKYKNSKVIRIFKKDGKVIIKW